MITCLPLFTSRDDLLTASIDDCLTAVINACLYLWLPLLMIYNGIPAGASTGGGAAALPALSRHDRRSIKQAAGARGRRGVSRKNHGCPTRAALVGARAGVLPASEALVVKSGTGSKNTVFARIFTTRDPVVQSSRNGQGQYSFRTGGIWCWRRRRVAVAM